MYYKKMFGSGLDKKQRRDPRDKIWAEFHCDLCGKVSEIDVTRVMDTFDFKRERKCPKCGNFSKEDMANNLRAQLDKLTADKSRIEIQIEQVERELNEIHSEKEVDK